eukprot:CAMPEP_0201687632 /NCGR_PEP_ID=MMETSP0578-20130828/1605_1 /ASSEMBLY_ACC=CAM_ASM_000663 /TAXON_ID=267565 /ORGANISM="Skeletonema grethea, Strain CCMP 1804" /LENGTH=266 /DNA_ID=CAMNT_0048171799 /DNA_START=113 /DNA_END=913 /DNA_ORIENTATION=-
MTVNDIGKIVLSVGVTQILADLLSRKYIFQSDSYKKTVATFQRAQDKRDKTAAALSAKRLLYQEQQQKNPGGKKSSQQISAKSLEKDEKRLKFESTDVTAAAAEVARRHTSANFYTAVVFFILYRILANEYSGKIVALLPFEPFHLLQKMMTFRGLAGAAGFESSTEFHFLWVKTLGGADGDSITQPVAPLSPDINHASQACAFAFIYFLCNMSVKVVINMILGVKPPPGADDGVGTLMNSPQSKKMMESFGVDPDEVTGLHKKLS